MSLPSWNSIEGASWWSTFYFWASIVSLLALGVTEVLSHRYGERKDALVAAQEKATEQRYSDEASHLRAKLEQTSKQVADDHSLKNRIRLLFDSVDPQIDREIDGGQTDRVIRMPPIALENLAKLLNEEGADQLMTAERTGRTWDVTDTINNGSLGPSGSGSPQVEIRATVSSALKGAP